MRDFLQLKKTLPVANANFRYLRSHKLTYVDKTAYVYQLAIDNQPRVLVRPRRFGKSTLLSALEELFLHGVDPYDGHDSYFKGLAIEQLWDDHAKYLVLHLDFYNLNLQCTTFEQFEQKVNAALDAFAAEHQLTIKVGATDFSSRFDALLKGLTDGALVLLVDEYDAPLIYRLQDQRQKHQTAALLQALFALVKSNSEKFRCVFVTGITRYQDMGLGMAGGSLTDITNSADFGACCGYTRAELKQYFAPHLKYVVAVQDGVSTAAVTDAQIEALLDALGQWYDGFCFDDCAESKVFSTWSVLRFFLDRKARFHPYWSAEESSGLPQLLKHALDRLDFATLLKEAFSGKFCISYEQFMQAVLTDPQANPYALLFQTGYLTLKEPFLNGEKIYLDCPNKESSMAFANLVARRVFQDRLNYSTGYSERTVEVLTSLDSDRIKDYFNALFAALPYEHYPVYSESMVAALINFHLRGAGLRPRGGVSESLGRADLQVDLPQHNLSLVFEYKYEHSQSEQLLDAKLQEAEAQIKNCDYGNNAATLQKVARFALVFCGHKEVRHFARCKLVDVLDKATS